MVLASFFVQLAIAVECIERLLVPTRKAVASNQSEFLLSERRSQLYRPCLMDGLIDGGNDVVVHIRIYSFVPGWLGVLRST